jgi:hypothetical protein
VNEDDYFSVLAFTQPETISTKSGKSWRTRLRASGSLRGQRYHADETVLCAIVQRRFLTDVPLIWQAKESNWNAHCSIEVQLLCGTSAWRRPWCT